MAYEDGQLRAKEDIYSPKNLKSLIKNVSVRDLHKLRFGFMEKSIGNALKTKLSWITPH